jgi:hypothetical protein
MRSKKLLFVSALFGTAALLAVMPVLGQERPESILPPGFGEPDAPPKPARPTPPVADPSDGGTTSTPRAQRTGPSPARAPRRTVSGPKPGTLDTGLKPKSESDPALVDPDAPMPIIVDIPPQSRRSTAVVGALALGSGNMGTAAFQNVNGAYLAPIMRSLKLPLASRWASVFLRRALLTHSATPVDVNGADWVAERASILARMGESHSARLLVQAVDVDQYTPRMFDVAMDTAMASADPAMLCGMTDYVKTTAEEAKKDEQRTIRWNLAKAMCSGLSGESGVANANLERARNKIGEDNVDALLPEKVIGSGLNTKRSVVVEWDSVKELTAWRFGLATATALPIPDRLYPTMGLEVRGWEALAPLLPAGRRVIAADGAAELGVLSSAALVDVYSVRYDQTDPAERKDKPFSMLRQAYAATTVTDRITAMKALWAGAEGATIPRFAGLIATARAAARIAPSAELEADAPNLVASMLTAGLEPMASKWLPIVGDSPSNGAWGLLAVAGQKPISGISAGMIEDYGTSSNANSSLRARFLFAGLAGLGRISNDQLDKMAERFEVPVGRKNSWTEALQKAADAGSPGSVAILIAAGLQARSWSDVPPMHLFHIVRALRTVGYDAEARMIAAEALMRV